MEKGDKLPDLWDINDVGNWVTNLGYSQYCTLFIEKGVDGPKLLNLTEEELKDSVGVSNILHRKTLLRGVSTLKESATENSSNTTPTKNPSSPTVSKLKPFAGIPTKSTTEKSSDTTKGTNSPKESPIKTSPARTPVSPNVLKFALKPTPSPNKTENSQEESTPSTSLPSLNTQGTPNKIETKIENKTTETITPTKPSSPIIVKKSPQMVAKVGASSLKPPQLKVALSPTQTISNTNSPKESTTNNNNDNNNDNNANNNNSNASTKKVEGANNETTPTKSTVSPSTITPKVFKQASPFKTTTTTTTTPTTPTNKPSPLKTSTEDKQQQNVPSQNKPKIGVGLKLSLKTSTEEKPSDSETQKGGTEASNAIITPTPTPPPNTSESPTKPNQLAIKKIPGINVPQKAHSSFNLPAKTPIVAEFKKASPKFLAKPAQTGDTEKPSDVTNEKSSEKPDQEKASSAEQEKPESSTPAKKMGNRGAFLGKLDGLLGKGGFGMPMGMPPPGGKRVTIAVSPMQLKEIQNELLQSDEKERLKDRDNEKDEKLTHLTKNRFSLKSKKRRPRSIRYKSNRGSSIVLKRIWDESKKTTKNPSSSPSLKDKETSPPEKTTASPHENEHLSEGEWESGNESESDGDGESGTESEGEYQEGEETEHKGELKEDQEKNEEKQSEDKSKAPSS